MICSESTKLGEYNSQQQNQKLSLVKLIKNNDEKFVQHVFLMNDNIYASDLLMEYLNKQNVEIIKGALENIVEKFIQKCSEEHLG